MKNIIKIIRISKPLHSIFYLISLLIVAGALIELVIPLFSKFIVDDIVANLGKSGGKLDNLIFLITLSFIVGLFGNFISAFSDRLGDHFAGRLRQFLTEKFYDKVLSLPQSYFDSEISGKIVNQLNRGIATIQDFLNTLTNFILPIFLQSFFTILLMAKFNVTVAIFAFILFPIYLSLSYYSTKRWGIEEIKKNKIEDLTRGRIQEVIANMKLVKSFNTQKTEFDFTSANLLEINKIYAKQSQTFHIFDFLRNLSLNVILTAVNVVVFISTFQGRLTLGEMVLILQLMNQVRRPLFGMSFILEQIQRADSGSKEFFEILNIPSTEKYSLPNSIDTVNYPTITFKNVDFKYQESPAVLQNVSFHIKSQEKVALVGHSGVGKTTIVNLILKFYEPTRGNLLMKNKDYSKLNHQFVRSNIALVFQESELFSTTIRENVSYGTVATEKQILDALKKANAYDFVMKLPQKLDSQIGERGVKLSGGQKQRVQIARAILKNSPILILDEATSSLDSKSEKEVQVGLENLMKNKLVIIIAHRFSTIQDVNKVIVIDKGTVVDYGSPKELSTRKGLYRDLLNYQVEGNKKLLEQFEIY